MGQPRKVFRIEETEGLRRMPPSDNAARADFTPEVMQDVAHELTTLRAMLASSKSRLNEGPLATAEAKLDLLVAEINSKRAALMGEPEPAPPRLTQELAAAVEECERATQRILAAAQDIDRNATDLSAVTEGAAARGLTRDIRGGVIAILEACNFQDVAEQRIAKVMKMLDGMEKKIGDALLPQRSPLRAPAAHGPKLENEPGHLSQRDIDALFANGDALFAERPAAKA
jgi:chemotaxis protein CheZ